MKKESEFVPNGPGTRVKKIKFKWMLLVIGVLFISPWAMAQDKNARVNLHLQGATLKEFVQNLKKQTGFAFFYKDDVAKAVEPITANVQGATLESVLQDVLGKKGCTFTFEGENVVIKLQQQALVTPQETVAIGTVVDTKGQPLPGVTVLLKGTTVGTATDPDGRFKLTLPAMKQIVLQFSFIGMKPKEVAVKGKEDLRVVMEEDATEMDEVVVTGIFNKPRESYTGAVTTVTKEEIQMFKGANMLQTLRNIDPAFNMVQNNEFGSDPNHLPEINLRGSSSLPTSLNQLNQGAQAQLNTPLIIMDGFEISLQNLMDFNDEDIESINILKDASATSIYGSRGANGVIVITTKAPEVGELKVKVTGGINLEIPDLTSYDLLNAAEKLDFEQKMGHFTANNNRENLRLQQLYNELLLEVQNGVDTYWLSQPLRTGVGQKYNLSLNGGSKEFRWLMSLGFDQTIGVMKDSKRDNFSGSITLTYNLPKIIFRNQAQFTNNVGNESPYGYFSEYVRMNPYWRIYDENGQIIKEYQTANMREVSNPLYNASLNSFQNSKDSQISNNFSMEWDPFKGMKVKVRLGLKKGFKESNKFTSPRNTMFDSYTGADYFRKGTYELSSGRNWSWDGNVTLSYSHVFKDKHQLYAGFDFSASESNSYSYNVTAEGFGDETYDFFGNGTGFDDIPGGSESISRRVGFTGTVNYTFDNRVFVDGSVRTDGSSAFGGKGKFAPFWSLGVGWNLHKENFIENLGIISNLRLKVSYGQTGSQQFAAYQALSTYSMVSDSRYMMWNVVRALGHANEDLKWQTTNQFNGGVELGLWNNRLSFQVDVYKKKTVDLLSTISVPTSTGFSDYTANIGSVQNTGFEGKITGYLIRDTERELMWSVTGTIVHNKNKILELSDAIKEQTEQYIQNDTDSQLLFEGESTTEIYAVPSLGVDPSTGNEIFLDKNGNPTYTWHADSRRSAGNSEAKYRGNISSILTWKRLSLSLSFAYQWGGQQYNSTLKDRVEISYNEAYYNVDRRVYEERWMKPGDHAYYPKFSYNDTKSSSRFVQDDNVFQLQTVALNYTNTSKWLRKMHIESFNVAINASDIFYVSTIKRERGTNYPFARHATISFGFQF